MELLVFLFIVFVAVAIWVYMHSLERTANNPSRQVSESEFDESQHASLELAQRLVEIINESLKIANKSKNADIKISRLDLAKIRLDDLKGLAKDNPFIKLTQLSQVERSIAELEREFIHAQYREAAEGNNRGQALEKEGNVDEAIQEYERLLADRVHTPFTYRRLAIIYSKRKKKDDELRVLRAAIKNLPVESKTHYQWFIERLAKKL